MRRIAPLLFLAACSSPALVKPVPSAELWIANTDVIDVVTGSIARGRDVHIKGGLFAEIVPAGAAPQGAIDGHGASLIPGLIDAHVHFGFTEKITEYSTETAYAAQGGFATVLGYFLNNEAYGDVYRRERSEEHTSELQSL